MKDFIDRMLPQNHGEIVRNGDLYVHPRREGSRRQEQRYALISNCGFPGAYNFKWLEDYFQLLFGAQFCGSILCAQGGALRLSAQVAPLHALYQPYLKLVEQAAEELIRAGAIDPATAEKLCDPVMDPEAYMQMANSRF